MGIQKVKFETEIKKSGNSFVVVIPMYYIRGERINVAKKYIIELKEVRNENSKS